MEPPARGSSMSRTTSTARPERNRALAGPTGVRMRFSTPCVRANYGAHCAVFPDDFAPPAPLRSSACLRRTMQASDDGDTKTCASGTNGCSDGTNSSSRDSPNSPNGNGHICCPRFVDQADRLGWRTRSRSSVRRRVRTRASRPIRRTAPDRPGISIRRRAPHNARSSGASRDRLGRARRAAP